IEERLFGSKRSRRPGECYVLLQLRHPQKKQIVYFAVLEARHPRNSSHFFQHSSLVCRCRRLDRSPQGSKAFGKCLRLQVEEHRVIRWPARDCRAISFVVVECLLWIPGTTVSAVEQGL